MGYAFAICMVIGIIYYTVQSIKERMDEENRRKRNVLRENERRRQEPLRYKKICVYHPQVLRKVLSYMYVDVYEDTDSAEIILAKVNNNVAVEKFIDKLDEALSKGEIISFWKEVYDYQFFYMLGVDYHRKLTLLDLENEYWYEKGCEEIRRKYIPKKEPEAQEEQVLKDKYGELY